MEAGTEFVVTPPELIVLEACLDCPGLSKKAGEAALNSMRLLPPSQGRPVVVCRGTGVLSCRASVRWEGNPICDELGRTAGECIASAERAGAVRYPITAIFSK